MSGTEIPINLCSWSVSELGELHFAAGRYSTSMWLASWVDDIVSDELARRYDNANGEGIPIEAGNLETSLMTCDSETLAEVLVAITALSFAVHNERLGDLFDRYCEVCVCVAASRLRDLATFERLAELEV